jgi:hypothetical protein
MKGTSINLFGFTSCQREISKAQTTSYDVAKKPLYPVIFEIIWSRPTGIFILNDPKYSVYPFEKEIIVTDGKMLIVKDVKLQKMAGQGWNYTLITFSS